MAINKRGTSHKIQEVVTGDSSFEKLKKKIAEDNNLKRCKCGQLLAKFDTENKTINIQKKQLDVIADVQNAMIKCPNCFAINIL